MLSCVATRSQTSRWGGGGHRHNAALCLCHRASCGMILPLMHSWTVDAGRRVGLTSPYFSLFHLNSSEKRSWLLILLPSKKKKDVEDVQHWTSSTCAHIRRSHEETGLSPHECHTPGRLKREPASLITPCDSPIHPSWLREERQILMMVSHWASVQLLYNV